MELTDIDLNQLVLFHQLMVHRRGRCSERPAARVVP